MLLNSLAEYFLVFCSEIFHSVARERILWSITRSSIGVLVVATCAAFFSNGVLVNVGGRRAMCKTVSVG